MALQWKDVDLDVRPATVVDRGILIRTESELVLQDQPKTAGLHSSVVVPEFTRAMQVVRKSRLDPSNPAISSSHPRLDHRRIQATTSSD